MPEPQDLGPLSAGKSTHLLGETDSGSAGGEPSAAAEYGENSVGPSFFALPSNI